MSNAYLLLPATLAHKIREKTGAHFTERTTLTQRLQRPSNTSNIFVQPVAQQILRCKLCAYYHLLTQQIFMLQKENVAWVILKWPNVSGRFPKMSRRRPQISKDNSKASEENRRWHECSKDNRRESEATVTERAYVKRKILKKSLHKYMDALGNRLVENTMIHTKMFSSLRSLWTIPFS